MAFSVIWLGLSCLQCLLSVCHSTLQPSSMLRAVVWMFRKGGKKMGCFFVWHGLYIYALQTETVNNILTLAQSSQLYLCVCNIHTQSELDQTRTCWKNVLVNPTLLLWPRSNMLVKQHCPSPRSVYTAGVCVWVCVCMCIRVHVHPAHHQLCLNLR